MLVTENNDNDLANGAAVRGVEVEGRLEIARKISDILAGESAAPDREAAIKLARVLVDDVAVSVRETLAKELTSCTFLPQDIMEDISQDIDSVAVPFLVASKAVTDEFLEEIVRDCNSALQKAIASRESISEALAYILCDTGDIEVVDTLVRNDGARISERACDAIVGRFPEEESMLEILAKRADLPFTVVEKLVFKVSQEFGEYLIDKFQIAPDYSSYLVSLAKRQVFARASTSVTVKELLNYLDQLLIKGGLTSDVLLTALQHKNIRFFTAALSVLSGKEYALVDEALEAGGREALAKVLNNVGFSNSVNGVILIAYDRLLNE